MGQYPIGWCFTDIWKIGELYIKNIWSLIFVLQISAHACTKTNNVSYIICKICNSNRQSAKMLHLLHMCNISSLFSTQSWNEMCHCIDFTIYIYVLYVIIRLLLETIVRGQLYLLYSTLSVFLHILHLQHVSYVTLYVI